MFILFVSIIGFGFLYEIFITKPDPSAILYHSFVPILANSNALLISVGIIGATVMPHALFVHSWLTKNKIKDKSIQEKRTLRKLHLTETVGILIIAGMVNAAIMIIAAAAFHAHFSNIASISDAYKTLNPAFWTWRRDSLHYYFACIWHFFFSCGYFGRSNDNGRSVGYEG